MLFFYVFLNFFAKNHDYFLVINKLSGIFMVGLQDLIQLFYLFFLYHRKH